MAQITFWMVPKGQVKVCTNGNRRGNLFWLLLGFCSKLHEFDSFPRLLFLNPLPMGRDEIGRGCFRARAPFYPLSSPHRSHNDLLWSRGKRE